MSSISARYIFKKIVKVSYCRSVSFLPIMSTLHLSQGSQQPPKVDGKLRLYSMEYCPYAQRTRLVLNAKKIPHDIVNINLYDKPDWFLKIHPEGKVPVIDTGSEVIIESLIISDFLEDKYPTPALYPKDPETKKKDKELLEKFDGLTRIFFKSILGKDQKPLDEWAKIFTEHLEPYLSELKARGTTFFGGEKPGMLDFMIWPWSERAGLISKVFGQKLPLDERFVLMKKWHNAMKDDPIVKSTSYDTETHWKYVGKRKQGLTVDYDNL